MKLTQTMGTGLLLAGLSGAAGAQAPYQGDRQFLDQATSAGLSEVIAGQRATQQGSPPVQVFGRWMVADHTLLNELLADRAKEMGIALPGESVQANTMGPDYTGKHGAAFDALYLKRQVDDHQKAIVLFENEAAQGNDPTFKRLAQTAVPLLRQHLAAAQALEQGTPGK